MCVFCPNQQPITFKQTHFASPPPLTPSYQVLQYLVHDQVTPIVMKIMIDTGIVSQSNMSFPIKQDLEIGRLTEKQELWLSGCSSKQFKTVYFKTTLAPLPTTISCTGGWIVGEMILWDDRSPLNQPSPITSQEISLSIIDSHNKTFEFKTLI